MATVKSVTVHSNRPLSSGQVNRRYLITLTDILGNDHSHITMPIKQAASDNGTVAANDYLNAKKMQEIASYKAQVEKGINPFVSNASSFWNTRGELLKPILDDALTLPASNPLVQNGLPYFDLVTDAEIMALYNRDQVFVDGIRAKAVTLTKQLADLATYTPVVL